MRRLITYGTVAIAAVLAMTLAAPPLGAQGAPASPKLAGNQASGGGPKDIAKPWTMPRTPDGRPDLQGNWSNATQTPLERPQGQPLIMSDEGAAKIEDRVQVVKEFRDAPSDPNRPPPSKGGDDRALPPGEPTFIERISQAAGGRVGGYNNFWLDPGERVLRIDGKARSGMVIDPPDGRVPGTTPEARKRMAAEAARRKGMNEYDHPELRGNAERCILSFGSNLGPPMLPNYFYNNNYQIVQTKDHVMIMTEMVHDVRVIRLGANLQHPPAPVRQYGGDSIGRWEGDTLVVETTNFPQGQAYRGAWENLKIIERFTRVGPDQIVYRFIVEDPTTFTAAWTAELAFNKFDEQIFEYACHEGNYALSNVLGGERAKEKREAEAKKPQP